MEKYEERNLRRLVVRRVGNAVFRVRDFFDFSGTLSGLLLWVVTIHQKIVLILVVSVGDGTSNVLR